jgi:peptidyl-prolyl cis-trans isomerase C
VRHLAAVSALLLAALAAACNPAPKSGGVGSSEITKGADPVVAATVNGKPIYVDDVTVEATVRGLIKVGDELPPSSDVFYQVLQDLIETRLMANEAEARGLDKQPDVKHRLDVARERILANVLHENMRESVLNEKKIKDYYRDQMRIRGDGMTVRARHILLKTRESAAAAKVRLDRGEPFETVAYDSSIDRTTGGEGGDLGPRDPQSFPEPLQDAIKSAPIGQISGPIQTEAGWHLIRVDERKTADPPSLESMRRQLEANLLWPEQRRTVERLKSQARIELFIDEASPVPPRGAMTPPADSEPPRTDAMPPPADAPAVPMGPAGAAGGGVDPNRPGAAADIAPAPGAAAKPQPGKPLPPAAQAQPRPRPTPAPPPAAEPELPPPPQPGERET